MSENDPYPLDCSASCPEDELISCADVGGGSDAYLPCSPTDDYLWDISLLSFTVPTLGQEGSVTVCNPDRWAVGQYFSIPNDGGKWRISRKDGQKIYFINSTQSGLPIIGNPPPGTRFPAGTIILPADSQINNEFLIKNLYDILNQSSDLNNGGGDDFFENIVNNIFENSENICFNSIPTEYSGCGFLVSAKADCPDGYTAGNITPQTACLAKFPGIRNNNRTFFLASMQSNSAGQKSVAGIPRYFTFVVKDPISGELVSVANSVLRYNNKTVILPSAEYTDLSRVNVGGTLTNKNYALIDPSTNEVKRLSTPSPNNNPDTWKNLWEAIHTQTIGPNGATIKINSDKTVSIVNAGGATNGVEFSENGVTKNVPDEPSAAGTNLSWVLVDDPSESNYEDRRKWVKRGLTIYPVETIIANESVPSGTFPSGGTVITENQTIPNTMGAKFALVGVSFRCMLAEDGKSTGLSVSVNGRKLASDYGADSNSNPYVGQTAQGMVPVNSNGDFEVRLFVDGDETVIQGGVVSATLYGWYI